MECLLPYISMVTVPHIMVGLERMLDYRGVGLERFHCTTNINVFVLSLPSWMKASASGMGSNFLPR